MSSDQSRRPPARSSGGGAPMGSTVSIIIAVVAVIVGFLILKNINDDDGGGATGPGNSTETTDGGNNGSSSTSSTSDPSAPTTTEPLTVAGAKVIVANASGMPGAAGQYTQALTAIGFDLGTATDAAGAEQRIDVSKVYILAGGEAVGASVARAMGSVAVAPMPTPVPITAGAMPEGATVLVMLGKDLSGKALPILEPPSTSTSLPTAPLDSSTSSSVAG